MNVVQVETALWDAFRMNDPASVSNYIAPLGGNVFFYFICLAKSHLLTKRNEQNEYGSSCAVGRIDECDLKVSVPFLRKRPLLKDVDSPATSPGPR